jgi:chromosome condensin MukBEF ATPase and DNA-binding subunit MukB
MEQTHSSRATASTSACGIAPFIFLHPVGTLGSRSLTPWTLSDKDSQISYEALKDENSKLRRKLNEVQSFSETQTEMVRTLEQKLEARMMKESDFLDLESVVQQVQQNLELMTKHAVKAENHAIKLKQEINLLQSQVSNFKRENEALLSGQDASLTVVKRNTDVALQNLHVVMNSAHTFIKQLISGAETLNLVAEILKSIDRISEIKDQGENP